MKYTYGKDDLKVWLMENLDTLLERQTFQALIVEVKVASDANNTFVNAAFTGTAPVTFVSNGATFTGSFTLNTPSSVDMGAFTYNIAGNVTLTALTAGFVRK